MNKPTKNTELPSFETVEQLMADSYLHKCISDVITEMTAERDKVSEGGKIMLKRNAVSFLIEMNKFNAQFIASEYIEIHYKRSKLSGGVREFITYLINECTGKTFKHYETLFQKQNKKTSKSNKNGN